MTDKGLSRTAQIDLLSRTLEGLLNVIAFEVKGAPVHVDGFCLRDGEHRFPPLEVDDDSPVLDPYYPPHYFRANEPRFEMIRDIAGTLLEQVILVQGERAVHPDGFRLKNLSHWLIDGEDDPGAVLNSISWACKVKCIFCYERGNPPELNFPPYKTTLREILTSVRYFDPVEKKRLPIPSRYDNNEILTFPGILEVIRALRKKTDAPMINISTSGTMLDEPFIRQLAENKPLLLSISLNSADPGVRASIMKEKHPEIPLRSLPLLKQYRIPFAASIVAWPTIPLTDIENTVAYADQHDPLQIRICLPGHTSRFSQKILFDLEDYWGRLIDLIDSIRDKHDTPIIPLPYTYEEIRQGHFSFVPGVGGVIKNSPAWKAGVRYGDEILSVNNVPIRSRRFLQALMDRLKKEGTKTLWMQTRRKGKEEERIIRYSEETFDHQYPYLPETRHFDVNYYGMYLYDGFDPADVIRLRDMALARGAGHVLVLTSWMIKPYLELALQHIDTQGVRFVPHVPENIFMGGNIVVGDLLTAKDFIRAIREYCREGEKPDLAVAPTSPFSSWLRDMRNDHFLKIERITGIPLYFMETPKLWS